MTPSGEAKSQGADGFTTVRTSDVLIVGSGVAGLSAALELARIAPDSRVSVLTRDGLGGHGASPLAQGGIAAALDPADSPSLHAEDTVRAADGLARRDVIDVLTREGPERVRQLVALGARFDRDAAGRLSLGLEGAHSRRRIVHAQGDRTGKEVTRALRDAVLAADGIHVLDHMSAVELFVLDGRVRGIIARDSADAVHLVRSAATILATGGPGRVYLRTTAPPGLDGDGLAMAGRAGAHLRDLEFVQFHPTALNVDTDPLPLVTEALRGSGALLVHESGQRLLDPEEGDELAPRDRVARAIWLRIQAGERVFLDARRSPGPRMPELFPGAFRLCRTQGIDPTTDLIPVTPAAHYHMGGVAVDSEGRASLPGLWAVGEVAASGVHGANRLASNSLLEGLVFGPRAARSLVEELSPLPEPSASEARAAAGLARAAVGSGKIPAESVQRIRTLLWERVGVIRDAGGLGSARDELDEIERRLPPEVAPSSRNLLLSARMITSAALLRKENLGSHWRSDARSTSAERHLHSHVRLSRSGGRPHIVARFDRQPSTTPPPSRPRYPEGTLRAGHPTVRAR